MAAVMSELLKFVGVTAMALITALTVHRVRDLLGPDGVEEIRKARKRMEERDHGRR